MATFPQFSPKAARPLSFPFRPFRLRPNIAIPPASSATRNRTLRNDGICPNIVRASVTELVDVSLQRSRRRVRVRSPAVGNYAQTRTIEPPIASPDSERIISL